MQSPPSDTSRDTGLVSAAKAARGESGMRVSYRVEAQTRYVICRDECAGFGPDEIGAFRSETDAYEAATALCRADHRRLGYPPDDPRIQYPVREPAAQD